MADSSTGTVIGGTASGAAAGASFGPYGAIIGGGIGLVSGLMGARSAKKAAKAQAEALKKRAQEIRRRGEINAQAAIAQGELDQSTYATNQASAGFRFSVTDMDSLNVLRDRASIAADNIRQEAAWEAETSIQEAGQYREKAKSEEIQGYLGAGQTILFTYSKLKGYS